MPPRKAAKDDFVARFKRLQAESAHSILKAQETTSPCLRQDVEFQKALRQQLASCLPCPDDDDVLEDPESPFMTRNAVTDALHAAQVILTVYEELEAVAAQPRLLTGLEDVAAQQETMKSMLETAYSVAHTKTAAQLMGETDGVSGLEEQERVLHGEYFEELVGMPCGSEVRLSVVGLVAGLEKGVGKMTAGFPKTESKEEGEDQED